MSEEQPQVSVAAIAEAQPVPKVRKKRAKTISGESPLKTKTPLARPVRKSSKSKTRIVPDQEITRSAVPPATQYIFAVGRRKRAVAKVQLFRDAPGETFINGRPLENYFVTPGMGQIAQMSIQKSPYANSVHLVVQVQGGGLQAQAEAVRLGSARALIKLDPALRPILRAQGYLTRDDREKERKKPGLKRARRAPQWQKR